MSLVSLRLPADEALAFAARGGFSWLAAGAHRLGQAGPKGEAWTDGDLTLVSESDDANLSAKRIVDLYRRHGLGFVHEIAGSLAFVLYDASEGALHAATSMVSKLRLAYWADADGLVVSTRALDVVRHPAVPRALDEDFLAHVLTGHGTPDASKTAVTGVRRLLPGFALRAARSVEVYAIDRLTPRVLPGADRTVWTRALWTELEASIEPASDGATCLSLSGGLDSALVASVFVRPGGERATAFSMLGAEGTDERAAIAEAARFHGAALDARSVDCSGATTFAALDAHPLPDDPSMTPFAYLPSRLRLWSAARDAGFRHLLDGDGGDELFELLPSGRDLLAEREWALAWSFLCDDHRRRALFARAYVLPWTPTRVRRAWAARVARRTPRLPTYLTARALSGPRILEAMERSYAQEIEDDRVTRFHRWLSSPMTIGAWATHRHLAAEYGLTLASPLLTRPLVELALGLPARWAVSHVPKAFLVAAAERRVPDRVRANRKNIAFPEAMFRALAMAPDVRRTLADARVVARLGEWIRFERVLGMLDAIAAGHPFTDGPLWRQLEGVITFAYWYGRAAREYGIV